MNRLVLLFSLASATVARADLVISQESVCRDLKPGAACRGDFGEGVCTSSTCTRNDYSEGVPPKLKVVECLKCLPKAAPPDAGSAPVKKKKAP